MVPASFTKSQRDARFAYTAVLRNLPSNLDAMDLHNIYSDTNAAAIGLPRNLKSYNNKPWAYFSYRSEDAMNAAMEMSFHLKRGPLVWCSLDEVKTLCPRCSSPTHSAKNCDAFSSARGRSVIPKSLVDNYEKFKPAGFRQLVRDSGQKKPRTSSRSKSRSKSRSRSRRRNNKNNKNNNKNNNSNVNSSPVPDGSTSSPSSPNAPPDVAAGSSSTSQHKKVSYADSLNTNKEKGKGKVADGLPKPGLPVPTPAPTNVDQQTLKSLSALINTAAQQLFDLKREFSSLKARCDSFDSVSPSWNLLQQSVPRATITTIILL